MKQLLTGTLLAAALALPVHGAAPGRRLAVTLTPRFDGESLAFDTVAYRTVSGPAISVTRLDFLLSNIALRRVDGGWLGLTNWFAYLSLREGRTGFELNNLPAGGYDRLRFQVGVPPAVNHADPAQFGPAHPLNPNVNGLHWKWQGGYVFIAIEGNSRSGFQPDLDRPDAQPISGRTQNDVHRDSSVAGVGGLSSPTASNINGYSYHIANDRLLMTVEVPIALDLGTDRELSLALNVDQIFSGQHRISITDETSSTHSREGDPLAERLHDNLQRAFTVERAPPLSSEHGRSGFQPAWDRRDARGTSGHFQPPVAPPSLPDAGRQSSTSAGEKGEQTTDRSQTHRLVPLLASNATPYRLTLSRFFSLPALPLDNPLTEEGVHLGRLLFHDPRLARNNAQSCASCHQADAAFTDAGKRYSLGAEGQIGERNAMPLFNLAWKSAFFWDGRAPTLREQVLQPIQNPIEMHESMTNVVAKLRETAREAPSSNYPALLARAFGTPDITADRLARALEQFLLTLVSHDSKFDRFAAGQAKLTAEEERGFELFHTEYDPRRRQFGADCFHCHGGPLFQNQTFANNGLDAEPRDPGRSLVTGKPGDKGKFAVPSLRNVALTAPYMHDGRFQTLEDVMEHYSTGVQRSVTLDPNLAKHPGRGVPLSAEDKRALVAFLRTLTDNRWTSNNDRSAASR